MSKGLSMGNSDTIVVISKLTKKQSLFNTHPWQATFVFRSNIVVWLGPPPSNSENSESQLQQHFASLAYPNELPSQQRCCSWDSEFSEFEGGGPNQTTMFERNTNVACQGWVLNKYCFFVNLESTTIVSELPMVYHAIKDVLFHRLGNSMVGIVGSLMIYSHCSFRDYL